MKNHEPFSLEDAAILLAQNNSDHIFRAADELRPLCLRPSDSGVIDYSITEKLITELDNILKERQ